MHTSFFTLLFVFNFLKYLKPITIHFFLHEHICVESRGWSIWLKNLHLTYTFNFIFFYFLQRQGLGAANDGVNLGVALEDEIATQASTTISRKGGANREKGIYYVFSFKLRIPFIFLLFSLKLTFILLLQKHKLVPQHIATKSASQPLPCTTTTQSSQTLPITGSQPELQVKRKKIQPRRAT